MPENNPESQIAPSGRPIETKTNPEYKPLTAAESPALALKSPEFREIFPQVKEYLKDLSIKHPGSLDPNDPRLESNDMESLFDCYTDYLVKQETTLEPINGEHAGTLLRARINQLLVETKNFCTAKKASLTDAPAQDAATAALAKLDAAIAALDKGPLTTPASAEQTTTAPQTPPAPDTTAPTPAETNDTVPANLYDNVLGKLKEVTPAVEPAFKTVAEVEAAIAAAVIKGGRNDGRINNKVLRDQLGNFIRINAGKADTAHPVMVSDVEGLDITQPNQGKPKWIVENGKVVGFHINEMGTRFQAHRQFAPGTETFMVKLDNNQQAWEIANNLQDYLLKLRKDFAAPGKVVNIAINRGTNELLVRRSPEKKAPANKPK